MSKMITIDLLYNLSEATKIRLNDLLLTVYELSNTIEYYSKKEVKIEYIKRHTEDAILYGILCDNIRTSSEIAKVENLFDELFEILAY